MSEKVETPAEAVTSTDYVINMLYDLFSSPVNVCLLAVCCYLLYKIYKANDVPEQVVPEFKKREIVKRNLTLEQLREFDGVKNETIIIAVNGNLYDVTSGASFYGPGGPYGNLAGRDASRAFAKFCLDDSCIKDDYDDISDLTPLELEQMNEWEMKFESKYYLVGKLLRPGEVSETVDGGEVKRKTSTSESDSKSD